MNHRIEQLVSLTAFVLAAAFLIWLLSLHGMRGLMHVEYIARVGVGLITLLALLPPVVAFWPRKRAQGHSQPVRAASTFALSVIAAAVPVVGFPYLRDNGVPGSDALPPRLLVSGRTGAGGLPDLSVASGTKIVTQLRDLKPGDNYEYTIDGETISFSTASLSAPLHFAVGSDAHFGAGDNRPDLTAAMLRQVSDPHNAYSYFFFLGDLVEYGFRGSQWAQALATIGSVTSSIPTVLVPGNHDTLLTGFRNYLDYCSPNGLEYSSGSRLWQRFDVGNIHFVVLDAEWSAETLTDAQVSWLEMELQGIPRDDWTIVLSHGFYYGSGSVTRGWKWYDDPETINRVTPLFEKYGVDIVFSGHAHQMEVLQHSGVTYVISGAFGGIPDSPRTYTSPASLWYAAGEYGFADVTVNRDEATITFRSPDGHQIHSAVIERVP